jgi:hypothetical protein
MYHDKVACVVSFDAYRPDGSKLQCHDSRRLSKKLRWITPKISPMDASCTDGNGKDYGKPEGLTGTSDGKIVTFGPS